MSSLNTTILASILLALSLSAGGAEAQYCGLEVPLLEEFDYEAWNGILRYALYIGLDDDGVIVPFDCTAEEWRLTSDTDYVWNVTYRYFDEATGEDATSQYGGTAELEEGLGAANWFLDASASLGITTHLMMIDTDYETYASYIECNAEDGYDIPIVQSLGSAEIDPVLLASLVDQLQELGASMDKFTQIRHDDECTYEF